MCDPRTVIEGSLKYRDGRKWKSRWCVVSKLSPVAVVEERGAWEETRRRRKKLGAGIDAFFSWRRLSEASLPGRALATESVYSASDDTASAALECSRFSAFADYDARERCLLRRRMTSEEYDSPSRREVYEGGTTAAVPI
ncbi:hypothetical protein MRX96_016571 [Rhipicephalus microplus]